MVAVSRTDSGVERIFLFGDAAGEHLRLDVREKEVVMVSHEMAISHVSSNWRDRVLVAMPKEMWISVAEELKER